MSEQQRIQFTHWQNAILKQMYEAGMNSTASRCEALIVEASRRTNLPISVVKKKIGNMNRALHPAKPRKPQQALTKGMSGYNLYAKELGSKAPGSARLGDWSASWAKEPEEVRKEYVRRAKMLRIRPDAELAPEEQEALVHSLKKQLTVTLDRLSSLGTQSVMLLMDAKGELMEHSTPRLEAFFDGQHHFKLAFMQAAGDGAATGASTDAEKRDRKAVQHSVQEILNEAYSSYMGKKLPFPYGQFLKGIANFHLEGAPVPLKKLSAMSLGSLRAMVQAKDIIKVVAAQSITPVTSGTGPTSTVTEDSGLQASDGDVIIDNDTLEATVVSDASTNRPVSPPEAGPSNASILSPAEEMFGLLTGAAPVKQLVEITDTKLEDNEYLVKKILKHRNNSKHGLQYLIRWEGYSSSHDSWEPASNLNAELVAKYHIKKK